MKVALATQDMTLVNGHFASAKTFAVYEVSTDGYQFVEAIQFDDASKESGEHTDEGTNRIRARTETLSDVKILFVKAIGGPAAARVVNSGIHPIKLQNAEAITSVLDRLVTQLNGTPPPWLRKALNMAPAHDMSFLDDDDEEEYA